MFMYVHPRLVAKATTHENGQYPCRAVGSKFKAVRPLSQNLFCSKQFDHKNFCSKQYSIVPMEILQLEISIVYYFYMVNCVIYTYCIIDWPG